MRVTDLARRADTTTETVRHYTDLGLLAPRRNSHNGYREYGAEDLRRLRFALKARSLGFTLSDVSELMSASGAGQTPCPRVRDLIETRLGEVEERIQELQALSQRMRQAMAAWENTPDRHLADGRVCGLIDSFERIGEEVAPVVRDHRENMTSTPIRG
ncbi:MerR family transcriptional regulator [Alloalcanivorax xenomutans]|jgi:MerR family transcriptional regulator, Zn(II)-responsive regulator of zntA|uniref:MerR family DNA-binding protein n=1 Tax=Alloalcanivorax xenomutans TaxID=1094342 RepID=A0A9Q3ZFX5_9GAMM|nr:MerR family DNA-binding protein [Alloalcanivorax xenomutans]ERS14024.1 MerR family transcriptional regulator [Alcanivorax sp. PN-3]KYZ87922.1 MerR family transcriptional regulator [Alcanivorax sp. KX64203]MBA4720997.1 MerR family DNA-binding protein [Alcanivorax sp.]ARB45906.1 MerR family transcriptional regulator [Alloalcanivorax xenomutans]MCE7510211.1 MerR family DNA-binding protein [Alloalcanivorax xenomutans]|tara:strand:- start:1503 stop:1976 length:474 start_codon:yes stop_codon:yes gene_type:complete